MSDFRDAVLWLFDPGKLLVFALALARMSGLMMIAPVYGSADVPVRIRALLATALALLVAPPLMGQPVADPKALVNFMALVATELAIGFVIGLAMWLLFTAVRIAGQIISQTSGMGLADVLNPQTGSSVPLFSQALYWVALAVFLTVGGHRLVLQGLLESFEAAPVGVSALSPAVPEMIIGVVSLSFELAVRIAAPAVTALLLATLVMGIISRTAPQLNILVVGFGVNAMVTFAVLAFSLGGAAWTFQEQIEPVVQSALEAALR